MKLAFIDIETTSLARPFQDPRAEVWEVGLIVREEVGDHADDDIEYRWYLPVTLNGADPESLEIGRFFQRHPSETGKDYITGVHMFAHEFYQALTHGMKDGDKKTHLVGNVVSFDEERLAHLLYSSGRPYSDDMNWIPWHYHIVDVEALVAGRLGIQPPWDSKEIAKAIGVEIPEDRHDALVDARWARDMYDAVMDHAKSSNEMLSHCMSDHVGPEDRPSTYPSPS